MFECVYCSGHMESHVGRCLVLDVHHILLFLIMKYWSILMMEIDHQNQTSVLIPCKYTAAVTDMYAYRRQIFDSPINLLIRYIYSLNVNQDSR